MDSVYRRGPYKRYLDGETAVPRETSKRWVRNIASYSSTDSGSDTSEESAQNEVAQTGTSRDLLQDSSGSEDSGDQDFGEVASEVCRDLQDDFSGAEAISDQNIESQFEEDWYQSDFKETSCENPVDRTSDDYSCSESDENAAESEEYAGEIPTNIDDPLYDDAAVTVQAACYLIMSVCMAHSVSNSFIEHLLLVIGFLFPAGHRLPRTYHRFMKLFEMDEVQLVMHRFCENCDKYLGKKDEIINRECPGCGHGISDTPRTYTGTFVEVPLAPSLKNLLEVDKLYELLTYPYNRQKEDNDAFEDVYDGTEYKKTDKGSHGFSLLWNCDGIPLFKSSNYQLWPIQCSILELPPLLRRKFTVIAGLWFGYKKPVMDVFLKPFVDNCRKLCTDGLHWVHPVTHKNMVSKVFTCISSCDAVARCAIQNMVQFNSFFGCGICEQKAISVAKGNGTVRVFPFTNPASKIRSDSGIAEQARRAVEQNTSQKGVKGHSPVSSIPSFSVAKGFVPDYMHCVLLGVVRAMLNLWIDSSFHQNPWYIGTRVKDIDQRLLSIHPPPPNIVTRAPRSITTRKYWKASEYRSWLLWYSIPVLQGILPTRFYQHFMLLSLSVFLLVSKSVSKRNLHLAVHLLNSFVEDIQVLYGTEHCSFNVHQLIHLPLAVQRWGPLWCHSTFPFEDNNHALKKLIHGTQAAHLQVVGALAVVRKLQKFKRQTEDNEDVMRVASAWSGESNPRNRDKIGEDVFLLDNPSMEVLEGPASEAAFRCIGRPMVHEVAIYRRAIFKSFLINSRRYEERGDHAQLKRNNSTVFSTNGLQSCTGRVEYFFKEGEQGYAVISKFETTSQKFAHRESGCKMKQFTCVNSTNSLIVVTLYAIREKGIWMELNGQTHSRKTAKHI